MVNENKEIVLKCFNAALSGPFFPEWEFHTLTGFERNGLQKMYNKYLKDGILTEDLNIALSNVVGGLLYYPHNCDQNDWDKYVGISKKRLQQLVEDTIPMEK